LATYRKQLAVQRIAASMGRLIVAGVRAKKSKEISLPAATLISFELGAWGRAA
jgi:hypothetical protein